MKPTDFASRLQSFLVEFLPGQRNVSEHTVKTYAHAFRLVLLYFQRDHRVPPERLTLDHLTVDNILAFLNWLETERSNSIGTRNLRLAGIHSFFRYVLWREPELAYRAMPARAVDIHQAGPDESRREPPEAGSNETVAGLA